MVRFPMLLALVALLASPAVPTTSDGRVLVVDASGAGDYLTIEPAVWAAWQGDVVLVKSGNYPGFTVAEKSVSIVADIGSHVQIDGPVFIGPLLDGRNVSISSFRMTQGFEVRDCAASVLFTDTIFREPGVGSSVKESSLHQVWTSSDVSFVNCDLIGRDGGSFGCPDGADGADGEDGLLVVDSTCTFYECRVRGGAGGDSDDCYSIACMASYQGDGGDGLRVFRGFIYLDATKPAGGPKGHHIDECSGDYNEDGEDVGLDPESTLAVSNHAPVYLGSASVVRDGKTLSVILKGPAHSPAWLLWSSTPAWRHLGVDMGNLHLASQSLHFEFLGKIPPGGTLTADLKLPPVPMGEDSLRFYLQPLVRSQDRILGNVRRVIELDSSF